MSGDNMQVSGDKW